MEKVYDVVVVGLGAMGSSALYQLSKQDVSVLGIDQHTPPHSFGSSHGDTRITRQAVGEGDEYVPLVLRSNEIWDELSELSGKTLYNQVGTMMMSTPDGGQHGVEDFLGQVVSIADRFDIEHERFTQKELQDRFPQFGLRGDETGYLEPGGGYVIPDLCISIQLEQSVKNGAEMSYGEKVMNITDQGEHQLVKTNTGEYKAKKVIVSPGAWIQDFLPEERRNLEIHRQVLYWFDIENDYERLRDMSTFIWLFGNNTEDQIYGFPAVDGEGGGLKLASENKTIVTNPDEINREVSEEEVQHMYDNYVKDKFPGLGRKLIKAVACMYTVTPDHKFIIDFHPTNKNIVVASPCSGHGFKHAAAIGEMVAQMATDGESEIDRSKFGFNRFSS